MSESKLLEIPGFTKADFELVKSIIEENVEIMDEDIEPMEEEEAETPEELDEEKEYYECPECGKPITEDMDHCPNCGVELSFEEEDEEETEEEADDSEEK
jgi:rubrerythrin